MKKSFILAASLMLIGYLCEAGPKVTPEAGYGKQFFKAQAVGSAATASFQITQPVSRYSIYFDQSASYTFSYTSDAFLVASATDWRSFTGSRTLDLQPLELSSGVYLWLHNGAKAQTIRFQSYGQ